MRKGNILLVNPPVGTHAYGKSLIGAETLDSPPVSLPQIASPFTDDYEIKFLDLDLYVSAWKQKLSETVKAFQPEWMGVTSNTPTFNLALECAEITKKVSPGTKTVIGGVHASVYPGEALEKPFVDFAVHGEGDFVFHELVEKGNPENVPGVSYRQNGSAKINERPPLIENLDSLGLPRYDLVELEKYRGTSVLAPRGPAGYIELSRGCQHRCTFCSKAVFGKIFRPKSPERVLREVEYMLGAGFEWIHFIDDGFGTDERRIINLCGLIHAKGLKFNWTALSGVAGDQWTKEMFDMLKRAGCARVSFGIESGSQAVLDRVKKDVNLDQIRRGVAAARASGLETLGFFILGLPGETAESIEKTISFAVDSRLDLAHFSLAVPYPGSKLYCDNEKLLRRIPWEYFYHFNPFPNPSLSAKELKRLLRRAIVGFYGRARVVRGIAASLRLNQIYYAARMLYFYSVKSGSGGVTGGSGR
ncbi:MAG: radical SAM protein [bacterium]